MVALRNFGFLLKDVSRLSSLNFERHAVELNMTLAQCKVLVYLERNEGITQVRLANLSDTDPMTVVRALDRMESEGLVERRLDPNDRRVRHLFLKPKAMPVLARIWDVADQARSEALSGLSAADRQQLMKLLGRIQSNLITLLPCADKAASGPTRPAVARKLSKARASGRTERSAGPK